MHKHHRNGREVPVESAQTYEVWKDIVLQIAWGGAPASPPDLKRAYARTIQRSRGVMLPFNAFRRAKIKGALSLARLGIRSLPGELKVTGHLDLRQCTRLVRLGDDLEVKGDLLIGGSLADSPSHQKQFVTASKAPPRLRRAARGGQCPLKALPAKLRVHGDLVLRSCRALESIPDDIQVGGSLIIIGCGNLRKLPPVLDLQGDLIIIGGPLLRNLPDTLHARGLHVSGCGLRAMPEKMKLKESIRLEYCPELREAPGGKHEWKNYRLHACGVEQLPPSIQAERKIHLKGLSLKESAAVFRAPRVHITHCSALETLTGSFVRVNELSLMACSALREFPAPGNPLGSLNLSECHALEKLPKGLNVRANRWSLGLELRNCRNLKEFPADFKMSGRAEIAGSGIIKWPKSLRHVQILWRGRFVPSEMIFAPETLSPERILLESNTEIRRLMLEQVGTQAIMEKANARRVDEDRDPGGSRTLLEFQLNVGQRSRPLRARFLHCRCPSTYRLFLLRVPTETETCRHAAAWLAGFDNPDDYEPVRET